MTVVRTMLVAREESMSRLDSMAKACLRRGRESTRVSICEGQGGWRRGGKELVHMSEKADVVGDPSVVELESAAGLLKGPAGFLSDVVDDVCNVPSRVC